MLLNLIYLFAFVLFADGVDDQICVDQNRKLKTNIHSPDFLINYKFLNDTKDSVQLTWAGENTGIVLLATTKEIQTIFMSLAAPSDLYRSVDNGKTFTNITGRLNQNDKIYIRKSNGLQRNPSDTANIFVVCYNPGQRTTFLFITRDSGSTWTKVTVPFQLDGRLMFHPKKERKNWILALDSGKNELHRSMDGGETWLRIHNDVEKCGWSTSSSDDDRTIYLSFSERKHTSFGWPLLDRLFRQPDDQRKLVKSTDAGTTWISLMDRIYGFSAKGKFLYASQLLQSSSQRRRLKVSTDGGHTFLPVQLPTITHDRFYSVLDMEDDMVFIHVDDLEDNGHGILYTSDSTGTIFSESLRNHLYPNFNSITDFYRIASMKGTYLTTRMNEDKSMQTVVTFNRGAEWRPLSMPSNVPCNEKKNGCTLQISGAFSLHKNVVAELPLAISNAVGLILAHGHVASNLKTSTADVYVSSNGGYNWNKALDGPHHYQIADQGGLLVAVPMNTKTPNVVKFSTDEGRCWHTYKFTKESVTFTGLHTEPGNRAMTVAIWGYGNGANQQWRVHVIDFSKIITRTCDDSDYEDWYAHSEMTHPLGANYKGCLLGVRENFKRLKKDSLCSNGYLHSATKTQTFCPCTKDDFECEYGFYRRVNSGSCERNPQIKELDICSDKGHVEVIKSQGYRKIPGDVCVGGFTPNKTQQTMLNKLCREDEDILKIEQVVQPMVASGSDSEGQNHGVKLIVSTEAPVGATKQSSKASSGSDRMTVRADAPVGAMKQSSGVQRSHRSVIIAVVCMVLAACLIGIAVVLVIRWRRLRLRNAVFKYSLLSAGAGANEAALHGAADGDTRLLLGGEAGPSTAGGSGYSSAPPMPAPALSDPRAAGVGVRVKSFHDESDVDMIE